MQRIGIICNLMTGYGGVQTCVLSLIKGLNNKNITPTLLTGSYPKASLWEEMGLKCHFKVIRYSISPKRFNKLRYVLSPVWEFVFYFKTSWLEEKYDFIYIFQPNVIINSDQKHLFYLSMSPRAINYSKLSTLSKIKNIAYNILIKHWHPIFEFQKYQCVINSKYTNEYFTEYYKKSLPVIHPSNAVEKLRKTTTAKRKNTVLFLSRIHQSKRLELFLRLAIEFPEMTFLIVGSLDQREKTYYQKLTEQVQSSKIQNLTFKINQSRSEVVKSLEDSEYYVFPAKNEHFGITTVEAILFGCIPFVHDSGGQREIVSIEMLRFNDNELISKFKTLIHLTHDQKNVVRQKLIINSKKFSERVYIEKMCSYID